MSYANMMNAGSTISGAEYPVVAFGASHGRPFKWYVLDAFWILFFIATSSALFLFVGDDAERYFWLAADVLVAIWVMLHAQEFLHLVARNAIFISWGVLACVSSVWSTDPWYSFYHGLQLLLTILAAILLCLHTDHTRVLVLIFIAMLGAGIISFLAVMTNADSSTHFYGGGWRGGFPHKNSLGDAMTILIVTGLCLFFRGWRRLVVIFGVIFAAVLVVLTTAATPIVAMFVTLSPLPFALALRKGGHALAVTVGVMIIAGAVAFLVVELQETDLYLTILGALGKDQTLTGRTILWDFAVEAFEKRPWLGYGFKGYWQDPTTGMPELRMAIGQPLMSFHNTFLETAVAFGVIGPILLGAGLAAASFRAVKAFLESREMGSLWPLMITIQITVLCFVENPLIYNHSFWQFILIVAVTAPLQDSFHAHRAMGSFERSAREVRQYRATLPLIARR